MAEQQPSNTEPSHIVIGKFVTQFEVEKSGIDALAKDIEDVLNKHRGSIRITLSDNVPRPVKRASRRPSTRKESDAAKIRKQLGQALEDDLLEPHQRKHITPQVLLSRGYPGAVVRDIYRDLVKSGKITDPVAIRDNWR